VNIFHLKPVVSGWGHWVQYPPQVPNLDIAMTTISAISTTQKTGRPFTIRANGTAPKFRRRSFWLLIAGTSLWITTFSVVIYHASQEPYDLWLMLDPADVKYSECWAKTSRTDPIAQQPARRNNNIGPLPDQTSFETRRQEAERLRQVAACYREINRVHQSTTRYDVLKQGVLSMIAVPLLFFFMGWLWLSFTSYPRCPDDR
jgi:hypothetical protein